MFLNRNVDSTVENFPMIICTGSAFVWWFILPKTLILSDSSLGKFAFVNATTKILRA